MLGLSRREARRRFDEIIAFSELEEFVDLPLKNYSSGMSVRLAFSVAIQVDADILLIDEVLAVGDAAFQQKCFDEFERLKREGRTIVLVTHDMTAVQRFCHRAMLIDRGKAALDRRPARDRARLQRAELRPPRPAGRRRRPLRHAHPGRDQGGLVRVRRRRADHGGRPGRAVLDVHGGVLPRRARRAGVRVRAAQRAPTHRVRDVVGVAAGCGRAVPGRRDSARSRALRQLARAPALHAQPVGRARGQAPMSWTCARISPRCRSPGARATGGLADVPHEFTVERP